MKIGLLGNQNSGKTTLFNCLTKMNAKIGNWPGVTIEKKVGIIAGTKHEIVDLPGIYSLSPYSVEEEVSRNFVFEEKPDVIINIVDATAIERSLYLTTQLLELDTKVIIALNMADILEKKGLKIDISKLENELGTKIVQISALKETGIDELIKELDKLDKKECINIYDSNIETAIWDIEKHLDKELNHKRFICVKLLEQDERFKLLKTPVINNIIKETKKKYDTDLEEIIAEQRYNYISRTKEKCVYQKEMKETISDKLDKILLNKFIAFPIFVVIMFCIYYLSVGVIGSYTVDIIGILIEFIGENVNNLLISINTAEWVNSLVVDGVIEGVGAVLSFVPQLIILFICISLLETTGYMSRIALLLDRLFRKIGLSGKSLIPFIVGSGCSVPGIMGSRIIENEDERKMTVILTPFIPCSAKLPIIALFAGYFFPNSSGLVSASLYFFAIIVIILSALIMKKFVFKNVSSTYISELPEYKIPSAKYVAKDVWDKVIAFIKRAGTTILLCSVVIWFLLSFSFSLEYGVDIENSMLAQIGNKISWVFYPMIGEKSWGATVSAIQGLVAKEQVVSSMAVINGLAEDVEEGSQIFSKTGVFGFFTASAAYAFMVFNLFSAPCFGAIGAMRRELGGKRKMLKAIAFQTILAWILATIVYQVGIKIENNVLSISTILITGIIAIALIGIIVSKIKDKNSECSNCPYNKDCSKIK
ncbi:MAG: ferrous iron transport protein B [Clostridiales bacterium]|nr:ferrous iron transport protein B [Clostridiales bacterium]